jgi:hypothetical protein
MIQARRRNGRPMSLVSLRPSLGSYRYISLLSFGRTPTPLLFGDILVYQTSPKSPAIRPRLIFLALDSSQDIDPGRSGTDHGFIGVVRVLALCASMFDCMFYSCACIYACIYACLVAFLYIYIDSFFFVRHRDSSKSRDYIGIISP